MFVRYVGCVGVVSMGQATLRGRGWMDGKWTDGWEWHDEAGNGFMAGGVSSVRRTMDDRQARKQRTKFIFGGCPR